MKLTKIILLALIFVVNLTAQEEGMTPDKNIGVIKREILNENQTCTLTEEQQKNFGLTPPPDFNNIIREKYETKTPPWVEIPGLWPSYDGRDNTLYALDGKYIPPQNGTPLEIANNFLNSYKNTLQLGDFPNSYPNPTVEDELNEGIYQVTYRQLYKGIRALGGISVIVNRESNISGVSIGIQRFNDSNKDVITPNIDNQRVAVNLAANYLKDKIPNLKRYAVWGYKAYVEARKGIPYTIWEVHGESDCPSAKYFFYINTETSKIDEVLSAPSSVE